MKRKDDNEPLRELALERQALLIEGIPVHTEFICAADRLGVSVERLAYLACWYFGKKPPRHLPESHKT